MFSTQGDPTRSAPQILLRWMQLLFALSAALLLLAMADGPARAGDRAAPASASPAPAQRALACEDGVQQSGALYRICMPPMENWNFGLVIFAHGYVSPEEPLSIPEGQMRAADGTYLPDVINQMGLAFAVSSYGTNGLAVQEGVADLVDLAAIFRAKYPDVNRVLLAGASEGSLVTILAIEQYPQVFDGGLALCGPIGSFHGQLNYIDDFRVVFDYFFPGLVPGSPISITQELIHTWDAYYAATVLPVITAPASAISITQLLQVTGAAYDPADATTVTQTIAGLLWYNILGTNDAHTKLGGQPFENAERVYTGSADDARLNAQVQRFHADPAVVAALAPYETSGRPGVPLVTRHTVLDPIVPYWHDTLYRAKVVARGMMARHDNLPPAGRYGHCNFTTAELQQALFVLQLRVANPPPFVSALPLVRR